LANYRPIIHDDHQRQYFLSSQTKQPGVLVKRQNYDNSVEFDTGLLNWKTVTLEIDRCTDRRIQRRNFYTDSLPILF